MTVQTDVRLLSDMRQDVYDCNSANGWFEDGRDFLDDIALLHSEVAEMFEAYRDWGYADSTKLVDVPCPDPQCGDSTWDHECGLGVKPGKPEGFGSECADVLVRLLDTSFRTGIEFGWPTLADVTTFDGFDPSFTIGGRISTLHALIAKIDQTLAGEFTAASLDPTLSYLVTWCRELGVDLQGEFDRKLAFNRTRGHKHGGKLI